MPNKRELKEIARIVNQNFLLEKLLDLRKCKSKGLIRQHEKGAGKDS